MYLMGINLWSVLVAAIATMVVGFLWYSPLMFARPWMVLMGYDREDKAKLEEIRKVLGGDWDRKDWPGELQLSGVYRIKAGRVSGRLRSKFIKPHSK